MEERPDADRAQRKVCAESLLRPSAARTCAAKEYLLYFTHQNFLGDCTMNNNKNSKGSTIVFIAIVLVICLLFAFYSQTNTASVLFSICFGRTDSLALLEQDPDWYGSDELRALQASSAQEGSRVLEALDHSVISYTTASAASRFINSETQLEADWYGAGSDKTVVLLHAYERDREFAARTASYWVECGYNVLIPQMRGHEGNDSITTLGLYEQYDLFDLLNAAHAETGVCDYVLHGEGMGANAALLLCGSEELISNLGELGADISFVVAEGASTDMMTLVIHQAARQFGMTGTLGRIAMQHTISRKLGVSPGSMDVVAAAANSKTPTLFITGTDEGFAPDEWTQELYNACGAPAQLLAAQGVSHGAAWERARGEYEAALDAMRGG